MPRRTPSNRRRTYLVAAGNKDDTRVFSGSTYHLALEGARDGLITGMVNLYPRGLTGLQTYLRYGWWKLSRGLPKRGGFSFTDLYLKDVWQQALSGLCHSNVINNFYLFGSYFLEKYQLFDVEPYPYIDGTLTEYFYNYRAFDTGEMDEEVVRRAIQIERAGYERCRKIIVMSKRTAAHITSHYGVSAGKIRIVPPGANIPERIIEDFESKQRGCRRDGERTLTIGFIGLSPIRKGLPTLADAVSLLRRSGYDVRLNVVGKCPIEIAQRDGVTDFGVIDKNRDADRFIKIVANLDLGCMLSHAELTGIGLLEFLRLGVPVVGTDVGGIPDIIEIGAGEVVSAGIKPEDLAERFARLIDEPGRLDELKERAWRRRHYAGWTRVVGALREVLQQ